MEPMQITKVQALEQIERSKAEIARHTRIKRTLNLYLKQLDSVGEFIAEENAKTARLIQSSSNHTRAKK